MKIVLATEDQIAEVADRYLVLELDTFRVRDQIVPSWCIVDAGDIPLQDMTTKSNTRTLFVTIKKAT